MTVEDAERLIAKTIDETFKSTTKKGISGIIGENTGITIGAGAIIIGFIIGAIMYGQNLQNRMENAMKQSQKETLNDIEKRFVEIKDYAAMQSTLEAMASTQSEMKIDIRSIRDQLESVKIRQK